MIERRAHVIKTNQNNETPHHVIFFDTETKERPGRGTEIFLSLRFGAAAYLHRRGGVRSDSIAWCDFIEAAQFWDWVESHTHDRSRLYLVAHNIVFDFKVLAGFRSLKDRGWKLSKIILNGTSNIWQFKRGQRTIVCLDNMNFFKSSLAVLGEAIGVGKLPMPADAATYEEWRVYCRRDVEVMLKAWGIWLDFLKANDLGTFGKTLASQALNSYRHRFMPHKIFIHTVDRAIEVERESYHGGRTECFFIGAPPAEKYHILDVNSMYPSIMKDNVYPSKLLKVRDHCSLQELGRHLKAHAVTARVRINCGRPVFGVVRDNRLIFPVGRFETTLTTRELALALKEGWIETVGRTVIYEQHNLFKSYVTFFYDRRMVYKDEGNQPFAFICKLLLNSLYGKFGQRNEVFEKVGEDSKYPDGIERFYDADLAKWITRRVISGRIEKSVGVREGWNTLVAIAAHITADARLRLWELIEKAGRENVYYCDTDSLFTNDKGLENVKGEISPGVLGKLSLKGTSAKLVIHAPKDYVFGDEEVIKGVRRDAVRLSDSRFSQVKFEGFAGALRKGRLDQMVLSTVEKSLHREYKKGIIQKDGTVQPFVLADHIQHRDGADDDHRGISRFVSPAPRAILRVKGVEKSVRNSGRPQGKKGRSK